MVRGRPFPLPLSPPSPQTLRIAVRPGSGQASGLPAPEPAQAAPEAAGGAPAPTAPTGGSDWGSAWEAALQNTQPPAFNSWQAGPPPHPPQALPSAPTK